MDLLVGEEGPVAESDLNEQPDAYYDPDTGMIGTRPGPNTITLKHGVIPKDLFPKLFEALGDD